MVAGAPERVTAVGPCLWHRRDAPIGPHPEARARPGRLHHRDVAGGGSGRSASSLRKVTGYGV